MIDKITNIRVIPENAVLKTAIKLANDNFKTMIGRVGLQFTTVPVTIKKEVWYDNTAAEKVEDVNILDNDRQTLKNPTNIPVFRACIRVEIDNPAIQGVVFSDVIVTPHIADSDACVEQLKMITQSGAIFVEHTSFNLYKDIGTSKCVLKLMFWAMTSRPTIDLDFDVILI